MPPINGIIKCLLLVAVGTIALAIVVAQPVHADNCLWWIQQGVLNSPDCANTAQANVAASVGTIGAIGGLGAMGLAGVGPLGEILNPQIDTKSVEESKITGEIGKDLQTRIVLMGDNTAIMLGFLIGSAGVFMAGSGMLAGIAGEIADAIAGARTAIQEWQAARAAAQVEVQTLERISGEMTSRMNLLQRLLSVRDAGLRALPQTMDEMGAVLRQGWTQLSGADRVGVINSLRGLYSEAKIAQALELARLERPLQEILTVLGMH